MNAINAGYRICKRGLLGKRCNRPLAEHSGESMFCPEGVTTRHTFLASKALTPGASNSFTPAEVELLHTMVTLMMRGADTRTLARHSAFVGLARKAFNMSERVKSWKENKR